MINTFRSLPRITFCRQNPARMSSRIRLDQDQQVFVSAVVVLTTRTRLQVGKMFLLKLKKVFIIYKKNATKK